MLAVLTRRAAQLPPTLLLISLVVFGLAALAPVDPARAALTAGGGAGVQIDDAALQAKRAELGLDRPLPERYLRWLGDLARLELGRSFVTGRPVGQLVAEPAQVPLRERTVET
jgi:ABC-type dipeptide/oligopeptide/nickel transport system permease component